MMDLDLNQEPLDPTHTSVTEFDSILNELESAHGHIQDRIRHLEAVYSRARQHHRWPLLHSPIQITNFTGEAATADDEDEGRDNLEVEERIVDSGKGGKSKGTQLVAKALGVETDASKDEGSSGNFFDCNICLDIARDPVLTCCGHLFCWSCFYQLSYAYSNAKECPVCKGEVTDKGIIPIYGNGSGTSNCQSESKETGLRVPPRPQAPRVEGIRQQLISQGASSTTIRNIRRFHNLIHGRGERVQSEIPNIAAGRNNVFLTQIEQGATSFPSLSSALNSAMNSAERLVEDLESYIHGHHIGGSTPLNPYALNRDSTFNVAAANHSESLSRGVAATNSTAAASVSPLSRNADTNAVIDSEIQTTDSNIQIRSSDPSSSSNRRRTSVSRRVSNEPRRRRLR